MGCFKKSKKDKDAEKLLDDVVHKVFPHLESSVKTLLDAQKQKLISEVIVQMQSNLNTAVVAPAVAASCSAPVSYLPQSSLLPSPSVDEAERNGQQNGILQSVIHQMTPYLEQSVQTMVEKERKTLVANVIENIQNNLDNKSD